MRASRHEKATTPAAPADAAHDIDFGHLWRQLKAARWTSKRPTGIQTEWTYASPTDDVLAGERAVAEFAFKTGLLVAGEDDSVEAGADDADKRDGHGGTDDASEHDGHGGTDDAAECDRHGGADDAPEHIGHGGTDDAAEHDGHGEGGTDDATIRPSRIDTSVLLLQNTVEQVVGSDSDASGVELSQNAVAKVLDLSQRDLHAEEGLCDAAASLHLLSEPSGVESEREDGRAVAPSAAPPRRHQIPAQPTADVNVLQNWENSCDYDELSSGDESDGAAVADDYRDSAFLASLHVGDGGLSRADPEERENTLRAMQWTAASTDFETNTTPYPGLGAEKARPVGELLGLWRSPLLTLFYFLPKSLWVSIATETNRYCLQQVAQRAKKMAARKVGRQRETAAQIARRLRAKEAYGAHEVLHVVGLLVAPEAALRLVTTSHVSFDESVLPATSMRNPTRIFMSDKLHRYGSKIFMLCDAKTAYCHRFEVYVGKREGVDNPIDFKTGAAAVLRNLSAAFSPKSRHAWHPVLVDRFYSSVLLAIELLKMKVYVVGTIQTNRLGFNKAILSK
ncbi:hypothetical protein F443_15568 [Phytophthora nicotianae P1569]|uniref:PiggyBac transposable element-derived protein domain-containing protein n=1 Tax=Phytophthora nicotianae P1569 TaxID=1317065 RepID=V9EIG2_PHYNI|nr:hypothetical protein F443_15568 [Phytophthora nicotianae P1569]